MSDIPCGALCRAVVSISDDEDAFTLNIKLPVDDRTIMISYPKPDGAYPDDRPNITLWTGNIDHAIDQGEMSCDEFEDWTNREPKRLGDAVLGLPLRGAAGGRRAIPVYPGDAPSARPPRPAAAEAAAVAAGPWQ
jgi:hypothetical protein